jgi:hypothetical protein
MLQSIVTNTFAIWEWISPLMELLMSPRNHLMKNISDLESNNLTNGQTIKLKITIFRNVSQNRND